MRQLFVLDPLSQIRPEKDSTAALMQAAQRAGDDIWACTPSDLIARGDEPLAVALPVTMPIFSIRRPQPTPTRPP